MSILELLQHIVNEPAPKLTSDGRFPKMTEDFVNSCLLKDPDQRRTPKDLLVRKPPSHPKRARTCVCERQVVNILYLFIFKLRIFPESRMDRTLAEDEL